MLTWNVTYHCKPGKREEFFKAISDLGVRACSIHETGNLKYDYFLDAQDPDALLLVETWQTPEDQQRHCGTETFAKLQAFKQSSAIPLPSTSLIIKNEPSGNVPDGSFFALLFYGRSIGP